MKMISMKRWRRMVMVMVMVMVAGVVGLSSGTFHRRRSPLGALSGSAQLSTIPVVDFFSERKEQSVHDDQNNSGNSLNLSISSACRLR